MPTLRARDREFHTLAAGQVLTVVTAAASAGIVRQYPDTGFNATSSQPVGAGSTVSIGPFSGSVRLGVECTLGQLDWSAGTPPSFPGLSDTETAVLESLVSGAWKRTEAVVKHIGSSSNGGIALNQTTGLSASDISTTVKLEVEAPFSAVRLALINRAQNAINANTAVVGVSETNATDTSANMGTPVIGGTAYAQLAPSGTLNGWRAVTWSGSSSVNVAAAASAQQFALSDWIGLGSVDRADGGPRPLLMWRTWRPGAASGNWSFNLAGASARTASAAMRNRTFVMSNAFSDAVTTLGATMSLATTAQPVFAVVRFQTPVLSVWGVGDSTMQGGAQAPENLSTWGLRACNDVSTLARPVVWANFGAASQTGATAWAIAKAALAAGCPAPSVLLVQPASVNDPAVASQPNVRDREGQIALALDVVATAAQYGIPYIIWAPLMPYNSLTLGFDNIRKGTNSQLQGIAASNGVTWLDFSALGDAASPERWVTGYNDGTGAAGDGIHPDEDAFDAVMAPKLATVLRALMV